MSDRKHSTSISLILCRQISKLEKLTTFSTHWMIEYVQHWINSVVICSSIIHHHYLTNFTSILKNPFRHTPTIPWLKCCVKCIRGMIHGFKSSQYSTTERPVEERRSTRQGVKRIRPLHVLWRWDARRRRAQYFKCCDWRILKRHSVVNESVLDYST